MNRSRSIWVLRALVVAAALCMASVAHAHETRVATTAPSVTGNHPVMVNTVAPSAGAMAVDLILVRPLSLAATVIGSALFVANLPLSVFEKNAPAQPFRRLVVEPLHYTFSRPLGAFN